MVIQCFPYNVKCMGRPTTISTFTPTNRFQGFPFINWTVAVQTYLDLS